MATKKQAPSDADRVFLSMQKPLKRAAKSIVKDQRRRDREEAAREKARQAELASEPENTHFPETEGLEEQARHAGYILTAVRLALFGKDEMMEEEERHVLGSLLWGAEDFLKSLDLQQVGLDKERARREAREAATRGRKAA